MLRLFGALVIERDGETPRFRSRQTIGLLAYLILEQRPLARDHLAALFWGDAPYSRRAGHLRRALHNLVNILPGCLESDRRVVTFRGDGEACATDIYRFQALVAQGDPAALAAAVDLYRGSLLEGFYLSGAPEFENWLLLQREYWRRRAVGALEQLIARTASEEVDVVIGYAQRLLSLEPWREDVHRQLMLLQMRSGRRSAALAHYRLCHQLLAQELDVEPEPETIALYQRIRDATPTSHNLPPAPTPFVGRRNELVYLQEQLRDPSCRLLTIIGLGGMGKSRLAQEAARTLVGAGPYPFLHGVCYVALGETGAVPAGKDPPGEKLALMLAAALSMRLNGASSVAKQLFSFLGNREMLLVLDSYDPRWPGSDLLEELLYQAPDLRFLVTAREPLRLREERRFPLAGLSLPADNSPAALRRSEAGQLLLATLERLQPEFRPEDEAPALARICHLTGGLPLALELAAASLPSLSPSSVAERLQEDLNLLAHPLHNVPARHRTLTALFEATWQRLRPAQRKALAALSLCQGAFSVTVAATVGSTSPELLAGLVQKSLLQPAGAQHYQMHPLLRQHATAHLQGAALAAARDRHAEAYISLLPPVSLYGATPDGLLASVQAEQENLHAAWQWVVSAERYQLVARLAPVLAHAYRLQGPFATAQRLFAAAIDHLLPRAATTSERRTVAWLHIAWTRFLYEERRFDDMAAAAMEAISLVDRGEQSETLLAAAYLCLGQAYYHLGNDGLAERHLRHAISLAERAGEHGVFARALRQLGALALRAGSLSDALSYWQEARTHFRDLRDIRGEAGVANNLGIIYFRRSNFDLARAAFQEAVALFRRRGDRWGTGLAQINLGNVAARLGNYRDARAHYRQALPLKQETGDRQGEAIALVSLSLTCHHLGQQRAALRHGAAAITLGQDLPYAEVVAYALTFRGYAFHVLGHTHSARVAFEEAITLRRDAGQQGLTLDPLAGLACLEQDNGSEARALALVEEIIPLLDLVESAEEPGRVYLTCYQILDAHADPRAAWVLATACNALRRQAAAIADRDSRQGFLQRVPYHNLLMAACDHALSGTGS